MRLYRSASPSEEGEWRSEEEEWRSEEEEWGSEEEEWRNEDEQWRREEEELRNANHSNRFEGYASDSGYYWTWQDVEDEWPQSRGRSWRRSRLGADHTSEGQYDHRARCHHTRCHRSLPNLRSDYKRRGEERLGERYPNHRAGSARCHYYHYGSPRAHSASCHRNHYHRDFHQRIFVDIDGSPEQQYLPNIELPRPRTPPYEGFQYLRKPEFTEYQGDSDFVIRSVSRSRSCSCSRIRSRSCSRSCSRIRAERLRFRYETYVDTWDQPVIFKDHDELFRPAEWVGKLEILEAQVAWNSGFRIYPKLMTRPQVGDYSQHFGWIHQMLSHISENLARMQNARFCGSSINIIAAERERQNVARVIGIEIKDISGFVSCFKHFLDDRPFASLDDFRAMLHKCSSFLTSLGLQLSIFHDNYEYHPLEGGGGYSYVSSRGNLLSSIFFAARAISVVLDLATISFCGAHLKRFDNFYFEVSSGSYSFPCGVPGVSILLTQRRFGCLEGFYLDQPAWVFSTSEHTTNSPWLTNETPLYLSTTPNEFAKLWGPMSKYTSRISRDVTLWFLVSPGFIIPGRPSHHDPALLEDEVLCHWTNDPRELDEHVSFPVRGDIERLLIGTNPAELSENSNCRPNEITTQFTKQTNSRGYLGDPHTCDGRWVLDKIQIPIALSAPLGPVSLSVGVTADIQRKHGVSCRENIRMRMTTEPEKYLPVLNKCFGVEISACTGNARRMTLAELLASPTVYNYICQTIDWRHTEQEQWLKALTSNRVENMTRLYSEAKRRGQTRLTKCYNQALQLAFGALVETGLHKHSIRAFWVCTKIPYRIDFPTWDRKWAGLLSNDTQKCALVVVNRTCLQCTAARLLCHLPSPWIPFDRPSVLQTRLVLNELATVPKALQPFKSKGHWSRGMIRALKKGDEFEMRPRGRLRVIEPLEGGEGIFVEWVNNVSPWKTVIRRSNNILRRLRRREPLDERHWEHIEPYESARESIPIFVVSNDKKIAQWLPWRVSGRQ